MFLRICITALVSKDSFSAPYSLSIIYIFFGFDSGILTDMKKWDYIWFWFAPQVGTFLETYD